METRKQKDSPRGSPGLQSPPSSPSLLTGKAIYIVTSFVSSGKTEIISNDDVSLQAFTKESKVKEYMKKHAKKLHDSKVSGPHKDSEHNTYFREEIDSIDFANNEEVYRSFFVDWGFIKVENITLDIPNDHH